MDQESSAPASVTPRRPTFPNAVVMVTDSGYLPAALYVAHRLLAQRSRNFDIVILSIGCAEEARRVAGPDVCIVDFALDVSAPSHSSRPGRSTATYGRLSLERHIDPAYRKVLYLDCDVWIGGREIGALFELDLGGRPLAAVRDAAEIARPDCSAWIAYKEKLGLDRATPYLNAGVLLIDMPAFIGRGVGRKTLDYLAEGKFVGMLDDQSALNAILNGDWLELSPIWNWTFVRWPALTRRYKPAIVHFVGRNKPWVDPRGRYPGCYRSDMARCLSTIGYPHFVAPVAWPVTARRALRGALREAANALRVPRAQRIDSFMTQTAFARVPDRPGGARALA